MVVGPIVKKIAQTLNSSASRSSQAENITPSPKSI